MLDCFVALDFLSCSVYNLTFWFFSSCYLSLILTWSLIFYSSASFYLSNLCNFSYFSRSSDWFDLSVLGGVDYLGSCLFVRDSGISMLMTSNSSSLFFIAACSVLIGGDLDLSSSFDFYLHFLMSISSVDIFRTVTTLGSTGFGTILTISLFKCCSTGKIFGSASSVCFFVPTWTFSLLSVLFVVGFLLTVAATYSICWIIFLTTVGGCSNYSSRIYSAWTDTSAKFRLSFENILLCASKLYWFA